MRLTRSAASVGVLAAAMLAAGPAAFAGTTGSASPATVSPGGQVTFTVDCGGPAASATLFGTTLGLPEQIPMTPAATAGDFSVTVTIPARTAAGPYNPGVDCSNNSSTTISLDVQDLPAAGGAQTGDGTNVHHDERRAGARRPGSDRRRRDHRRFRGVPPACRVLTASSSLAIRRAPGQACGRHLSVIAMSRRSLSPTAATTASPT